MVLAMALAGCGSGGNNGTDVAPEAEVLADVTETGAETVTDAATETGTETAAETVAEAGPETVEVQWPARSMPLEFTRPADGEPIPAAEVTEFTKKVTGLWKKIGYARWLLRTSIGVDPSTGKEPFLAWYNDVSAVKAGDLVTIWQHGGEHNMWIPGSKVLAEVLGGCVLTSDWEWCKAAEQYCKGLTAVVKGFVWDEDDPAPYLMARAILPMDQEFSLDADYWHDDGRRKAVTYHDSWKVEDGWNAHTFPWPHNPTWGEMYVTNMRSKDDVRAITRTTAWLPYVVADVQDEATRAACQETWDTMLGFHKDIVDSDYFIRTKGADGVAYAFTHQDLGNYAQYVVVHPQNECAARLATDLIAYGHPGTLEYKGKQYDNSDCGTGWKTAYEGFAEVTHYYNYPICWDYHMAAIAQTLEYGLVDLARPLLEGMAARMTEYLKPDTKEPGATHQDWQRDMALLLVQAAATGLPLTASEARHVQKHWLQAIQDYQDWPYWDLWDAGVPDGEYGVRPGASEGGIEVESLAMFMEYCMSPFQNPAGAAFVDCAVVRDMNQWGAE
jgi:hypothetical protein